MKKLFAIFAVLTLLAVGTTSCKFVGKSRLKLDIEASNKDCPIPIEDLGTLESIEYDEDANMIVFTYKLSSDNEEVFNMMQADPSLAKNMLRIGFSDSDSDIRNCLKMVTDADGGMRAIFQYGSQRITAELSNTECKDMLNNPVSEQEQSKMMLTTMVNAMNASCPEDLGDGVIIERIYDDGTDVIFSAEAPDYVVAELNANRNELTDIYKEVVAGDDMKELVELCAKNNKGIMYQFVGKNSGQKVNTRFSPEQLRNL